MSKLIKWAISRLPKCVVNLDVFCRGHGVSSSLAHLIIYFFSYTCSSFFRLFALRLVMPVLSSRSGQVLKPWGLSEQYSGLAMLRQLINHIHKKMFVRLLVLFYHLHLLSFYTLRHTIGSSVSCSKGLPYILTINYFVN